MSLSDIVLSSWPDRIHEYRLVQPIGQGAMGTIFLARDTLLERDVALKLLSREHFAGDDRTLFLREARALARVKDSHVVMVHSGGEFEGQAYLVTELVQGKSLEEWSKPVPWARALSMGVGIARGLAAAHRKNVLHRDVKPSNVMVNDDGDVKIVDFGLAKLGQDAEGVFRSPKDHELARDHFSRVSKSGEFVGTPLYMAPEVLQGKPASAGSDIYGVGALLYEIVAGVAPRELMPEDAPLQAWIDFVPPPLHERNDVSVEIRFSQIVQRCLARLPEDRFGSAEALAEALDAVLDDQLAEDIPDGNPYRGLEPFEMEHRGAFFGRDTEIRAVEQRLRKEPMVVVAGDSGVGKSSLCKAGVLPRFLRSAADTGRSLRISSFVPSRQPLKALQEALQSSNPEGHFELPALLESDHAALYRELTRGLSPLDDILLFVDQLEELCTLSDRREAELVTDALLRACAGPHVRVLATLRGDFITQMADFGEFGSVLAQRLYLLRPMTEEGIRAAIVKPALRKGVTFESDELVDNLVKTSAETPGGLPLLEFALAEMWQARPAHEKALTTNVLRSIGSISGALARHADSVLNVLGPEEKAAARRVLLSLTHTKRTRARRTWDELGGHQPAVRTAIDAMLKGRLIVARQLGDEGGVYEVAHEALLWEWKTLRDWIEQTRESGQTVREIEEAAELWDRRGRLEDETWAGDALVRATHAVAKWDLDLAALSKDFLEAGVKRRDKLQQRRRRIVAGVITALGVVAVSSIIAALAFAKKERQAIEANKLIDLAAADIGIFELEIKTFDWDAKNQKATFVPIPSALDWRLHGVARDDLNQPGEAYSADKVMRWERRIEEGVWRQRVEARSGLAFMEITGRGAECGSSWIRLQSLPGYAERNRKEVQTISLVVPTCQATREDMVEIPAGEFYGAIPSEEVSANWVNEVMTLPGYFIDRTEVTRGAYAMYATMELLTGDRTSNTTYLNLDRPGGEFLPATNVNAAMAANYCRFLGKRLPSMYQWLKAMRGGISLPSGPNPEPKRQFPWGSRTVEHPANFYEENNGDGIHNLFPVGTYKHDTSPYGMVDMAGNIREWTRDVVELRTFKGLRYVLGAGWDTPLAFANWGNMRDGRFLDFGIGMRCVRD